MERSKMPDTEKITINMSAVDLGKIDLLVQEGLYSNRTDFIRTAIRSQSEKHNLEIQQSVARHSYVIGVLTYDRSDLERHIKKGERMIISVLGLLHLHDDITAEVASQAIASIQVRGIFIANDDVRVVLKDRMR
jgi:Arc/MetJ-type ribon-helix-helix transcriptional regulator